MKIPELKSHKIIDKVEVNLDDRSYSILIGNGLMQDSNVYNLNVSEKVIVITDEIVNPLYFDKLTSVLKNLGCSFFSIVIKSGEDQKSLVSVETVVAELLKKKAGRDSLIIALGGGVVGENAAVIATGMQAKVHVVDKSEARLKQLVEMFGDKIIPEQSDKIDLNKLVAEADLLVGGVLIPGAEAPKLVTKEMIKLMKRGSVIVDVAIDQGGCVETSKPTTHGEPTYIVDDVVHYCVANMPGGVPRTSTLALNNATLPYLVKLANNGYQKALSEDKNFLAGLNVHKGMVTYKAVADVFGHEFVAPEKAIQN